MWQASVGLGSSSPLVIGKNVYFTGWNANRDTVVCLDSDTGQEQWRQSYDSPKYGRHAVGDQSLYSGACSTPEYDSQTHVLYTLGVDGDLNAWDTRQKGRNLWSVNLYKRYGALRRPEVAKRKRTQRDYGYMSSPMLYQDQLLVEVGSKSGNLIAFDKRTGREVWRSENHDEAGHTGGPVPITVEGIPCVAVLTLRNLVITKIVGSSAGQTVATYPWTTDFANNIPTPAVSGDSVIITSAYNHFAMCRVKVTLKGATQVWENEYASGVCSPIIHAGRVYWAWRGVHCVDFATGKEIWAGGRVGSQGSCILTSDDRLIVYANKGDLSLVETPQRSPKKFTQLAAGRVLSRTDAWPHVVLANGRLICRDRNGSVRCIAVSSELAKKANITVTKTSPTSPNPAPIKPSAVSGKPARLVTLKGAWPGTRDGLVFAWDRAFSAGRIQTAIAGAPSLTLKPREKAAFASNGALKLDGGAFLLAGGERLLTSAIEKGGAFTIEAVLTSSQKRQSGPARIITFSRDGYQRNFSLAQEGERLVLRLRTTRTGTNGMKPETQFGRIPQNRRQHVVVSYSPGRLDCWINGKLALSSNRVQGDLSNWDSKHHLLLGDEWDGGTTRKWRGTIDRFSIYNRAMSNQEVQQRHTLSVSP
jgi:outer membrane protein assembly factor BamB